MIRSEESENAVIKACFSGPKALDLCLEADVRGDWFCGRSGIIWSALEAMHIGGKPVDMLTLGQELDRMGRSSWDELQVIADKGGSPSHAQYHIGNLKNFRDLRRLAEVADDIREKVVESSAVASELIVELQDKSLSLSEVEVEKLSFVEKGELFTKECAEGVSGHLPHFCDGWTKRFGQLSKEIVFCHAPRSTGKTAFMVQWHRHLHKQGIRVPFFSLETMSDDIVQRYIAQEARINTLAMRKGLPPYHKYFDMARAASQTFDGISIYDGSWDIDKIRVKARQEVDAGAKGVFIDNLICIKTRERHDNQQQKYMHLLDKFREIRNEIKVPIVILAHPNADGNIKWAGELEDLADIVIYLWDINKESARRDIDLHEKMGIQPIGLSEHDAHIIATWQKNRDGETPKVSLRFEKEIQTFVEV